MEERMTREEIEELARQERLEYFKKWRANNKDKVRVTNQRYWKKRAVAKEQQQLKPYIKVESKGSNTIMEPNKMAFTLEEAAKELGVSKPTLYNLIKREDFPSIRLSKKKIIIPVEPLRKWLNDMAQSGDQK